MGDKESAEVLIKLSEKYPLTDEEKEALKNAIGVLSWTKFAETQMKKRGERRRGELDDI
jgi:hypothetical protein